jgi:putative aldouronate transport system substrate-binding protein
MRMKKLAGIGLSMAMMLSIAACGTKDTPASGGKAAPNSPSQGDAKIEISMIDYRYGAIPPQNGKGIEMINEKFNVDFKPQYVVRSDYDAKLSAVIASGEIPDIIVTEGSDSNFYKWAKQGAFLPLNDYIDKYPSLKLIPENVRQTVTVNNNIYAVQKYLPQNYELSPMIRQDWLDQLGLDMPTSYDELKKVAVAFTKEDPDGNGKDDTYGFAMAQNINPSFEMGAYWDSQAWYHKDDQGRLIPGFISDVRKSHVQFLADLYKEGAITKDFAVLNWTEVNTKEFYGGKAGIFIGTPRGMNPTWMQGLIDIKPDAKLSPIPPFKAPDGTEGYRTSMGFYGTIMLSSKLEKEPEKVARILEMIDYGRTFYPLEERVASNTEFDWLNGHEGQGYTIEDGSIRRELDEKGLSPYNYLPDNRMWAPSDEANGYSKEYTIPLLRDITAQFEKMHAETKHYVNPVNAVYSETRASKGSELDKLLYTEQTKMIFGEKSIEDWDAMVNEWKEKGGEQIIKEINDALNASGIKPEWQ